MNKFLRIALMTVSVCLALLCIAGSATSFVKLLSGNNQKKQSFTELSPVSGDMQADLMEEDSTLIFYSIEEYNAYLATSLPQTLSSGESLNSENESGCLLQLDVPDDIELSSIMVNDEGTIFTYDFEIVGENNVINFNTNDDVILELTHTIISKEYEASFISDCYTYAQNLAASIGAGDVSTCGTQTVFTGPVYADIYNEDTNMVQRVTIGTQKVVYTPVSNASRASVTYYYYPASISDNEFAEYANLMPSNDSEY